MRRSDIAFTALHKSPSAWGPFNEGSTRSFG
jgi:hypothetical protein